MGRPCTHTNDDISLAQPGLLPSTATCRFWREALGTTLLRLPADPSGSAAAWRQAPTVHTSANKPLQKQQLSHLSRSAPAWRRAAAPTTLPCAPAGTGGCMSPTAVTGTPCKSDTLERRTTRLPCRPHQQQQQPGPMHAHIASITTPPGLGLAECSTEQPSHAASSPLLPVPPRHSGQIGTAWLPRAPPNAASAPAGDTDRQERTVQRQRQCAGVPVLRATQQTNAQRQDCNAKPRSSSSSSSSLPL